MTHTSPNAPAPSSWTDAAIKFAVAQLPKVPTDPSVVATQIAALAARLTAIAEFAPYDPSTMTSIVSKKDYRVVDTLEGHTNSVNCLQALPDGRIVSGSFNRDSRHRRESEIYKI